MFRVTLRVPSSPLALGRAGTARSLYCCISTTTIVGFFKLDIEGSFQRRFVNMHIYVPYYRLLRVLNTLDLYLRSEQILYPSWYGGFSYQYIC